MRKTTTNSEKQRMRAIQDLMVRSKAK